MNVNILFVKNFFSGNVKKNNPDKFPDGYIVSLNLKEWNAHHFIFPPGWADYKNHQRLHNVITVANKFLNPPGVVFSFLESKIPRKVYLRSIIYLANCEIPVYFLYFDIILFNHYNVQQVYTRILCFQVSIIISSVMLLLR